MNGLIKHFKLVLFVWYVVVSSCLLLAASFPVIAIFSGRLDCDLAYYLILGTLACGTLITLAFAIFLKVAEVGLSSMSLVELQALDE